jgi:hypothetical protein
MEAVYFSKNTGGLLECMQSQQQVFSMASRGHLHPTPFTTPYRIKTVGITQEMAPVMTSNNLHVLYKNKLAIIIACSMRILSTLIDVNG